MARRQGLAQAWPDVTPRDHVRRNECPSGPDKAELLGARDQLGRVAGADLGRFLDEHHRHAVLDRIAQPRRRAEQEPVGLVAVGLAAREVHHGLPRPRADHDDDELVGQHRSFWTAVARRAYWVSALTSLSSTRRFFARAALSLPPLSPAGGSSGAVSP